MLQRNHEYCNHIEKKNEKSNVSGIFFVLLQARINKEQIHQVIWLEYTNKS